jgi:hypothetical protein
MGVGLSPKELSMKIGKTVHTLWLWRLHGKGPPYITVEGRVHYPIDLYDQWIIDNTRK